MPQRILALEVDAHELKAAVVQTTFRDYRIVGLYREPVAAADGSLADQVRGFLQRHDIEATTVLSSLPGDLVTWRTFFLPFRDSKRLEQTVPFELETQVPFGLDEVVVDYHVLHRDRAGSMVLAALVQRSDLQEHLAVLTAAGLDPKVVDLAPLATLNALTLLGSDLPDTFVYVGGSVSRAVVACFRNRQLVGLRVIVTAFPADPQETAVAASGNGQPAAVAERLAALSGEIRWTLLALNGAPLDEGMPCIVAGEGAEFEQLGQQLAVAMNLAVRRLDATPLRNVPAALQEEVASFTAPLGLALREVAPNETLGLNFRRGEFAYHRGQDEVRRALARSGALAALVLALVITNTFMGYQQLANRLASLQGQIRYVFTQTLPDVRPREEKAQLQAEIDAAQKRMQILAGIAPVGGVTAIDVLRTIATAIPDTIKIDIDDYIMDPDSVRIKGKVETFEAADTIKQDLLNTHYFADVQVKDVKASPDGKADFRLVLSLNKEGGGGSAALSGRP